MNFSPLLEIVSRILQIFSAIWVLTFGTKSVYDLVQSRQKGQAFKINPVVIVSVVLAIAVLVLSTTLLLGISPKISTGQEQKTSHTPVPSTPSSTSTSNVYPPSGWNLLFDDSMATNERGWIKTSVCRFTNDIYQISTPNRPNVNYECWAGGTNYSNFAIEVEMTIIEGSEGGIAFHATDDDNSFYYFHIDRNGSYSLDTYLNNQYFKTPSSNPSSAIRTGLNHPNVIAVVVQGGTFYLYINQRLLAPVTDATLGHGSIGLAATDTNSPCVITFSRVRVWAPSS